MDPIPTSPAEPRALRSHEWRETTDDGETRLVRAVHHGGRWMLEARLKSEPAFVRLEPIPIDDLRALLEVVDHKYRRGRAPHEHVVQLRAMLDEAEGDGD